MTFIVLAQQGYLIYYLFKSPCIHEEQRIGLVGLNIVGTGLSVISLGAACILSSIEHKPLEQSQPRNKRERKSVDLCTIYRNIKVLPKIFWLLCSVTLFSYLTVIPFNQIASSFFIQRWIDTDPLTDDREEIAGRLMSIPFMTSLVLVPVVGYIVDKIGHRVNILIISGIGLAITHALFLIIYPTCPLILLGVFYSMFSAVVWPTLAYVVSKDHLGLAYGVQTSVQNIGLTLVPMLVATALSFSKGNYSVIIGLFILFACLAVSYAIILQKENYATKGRLNDVNPINLSKEVNGGQKSKDEDLDPERVNLRSQVYLQPSIFLNSIQSGVTS
eukprot:TRINITY_DN8351_c0_g1_i4.p1 TRINITY_DN8351_c0_g1~~TRINITY_DN8351_c0_g1_i4.p1  ORF type:complete len:331 (+),score=-24.35 TRINITY_DN8351_c0_g1_i4:552-1544(+)